MKCFHKSRKIPNPLHYRPNLPLRGLEPWNFVKMTRDIRQRALEKIASLSAASSRTSFDRSDLDRLCKATQAAGKGVNGYSGKQNSSSLGRCPMVVHFST